MRAPARSTPAAAALSRAVASVRLRASTMDDMTGVSTATVSPAATVSPSRRVMRASRAATGAETVNRSFSRVRPSSSMDCSKRPCVTADVSTSTGRGAKAHASAATAASTAPAHPRSSCSA